MNPDDRERAIRIQQGMQNDPVTWMRFPCGAVSLLTPTRAALILSAKQWATAGRERAQEESLAADVAHYDYLASCFERIEKALVELEGLEK